MPWEAANVPHGVVHHHYYRSNIVGINSEYYVYTPPDFNPGNKQKYPVLYLLHGYSDDPSAWTAMAKANVILDNLIAQGKGQADDCSDAARLRDHGGNCPGME